ncbi:hypothetical protein DFH07DRAFT_847185 [Mycena maculata]|uniref:Uncharacterized protein n=1 Tax=Mycena maculata TaxID=230809 RepID=A0AAD7I157_9AGAR|nr:hypothetical protein DFH07DRAFT_847185 [Mycena maculata]
MPSETAAANPPSTDAAASQPPPLASKCKFEEAATSLANPSPPLSSFPRLQTALSEQERAEAKIHVDAFHKMLASALSSANVILEFWKDPTQWPRLQKLFLDAASNTRQGDTTWLKHKLNYLLADTTLSLTPKINENASKSARGRNHPMLRDAIVPWPDAPEPDAEPVPTPRAVTALKNLMKGKSTDGKNTPTASLYPSCFYAEGPFDPKAPSKGLFRSPFLLRVPKNCKARAHAQYTWTGEMIGYVCGQVSSTMISTSDWTTKDDAYNYKRMFKSVVKLFEKQMDTWVVDTLAFYQNESSDDDDDDDSDASAILALQAARDTPPFLGKSCLPVFYCVEVSSL